jgi:saccharopine dehydrogenase-like NADP-dependent oxidoreductase
MKKNILLLGAGRSSTALIGYLKKEVIENNWQLTVADHDIHLAESRLDNSLSCIAEAFIAEDGNSRGRLISEADVVISLLPPALHFLAATDCVRFGKNLLTASYVDEKMRSLEPELRKNKLFFLCEMGLDPGIDHMSAMQIIDRIRGINGKLLSFRSHCGGLVAPESDDNPWHYKISWNPANVVRAGAAGAVYLENGERKNLSYQQLFENCNEVNIDGLGKLAYYPNRDSLSYIPVYQVAGIPDFMRTTLRHPGFCKAWNLLVKSGLTDDKNEIPGSLQTIAAWSSPILSYLDNENRKAFEWIGLFDKMPIPSGRKTNAAVLQFLLEKYLMLNKEDKDMVVMQHEIVYERNGKKQEVKSVLIVKGKDSMHTAMAMTVGLPLGIAAKLILQEKIKLKGLHIPVLPQIYEPVLQELQKHGIAFREQASS